MPKFILSIALFLRRSKNGDLQPAIQMTEFGKFAVEGRARATEPAVH